MSLNVPDIIKEISRFTHHAVVLLTLCKVSRTTTTLRISYTEQFKGDSGLTREEKNQAMSYTPGSNLFERAYISKVSIVDGQSLFLRENPRRDHIEMLRGADRLRTTTLPQQMPAQVADELEQSPLMVELSKAILQLPPPERLRKATLRAKKGKLRQDALKRYQDQWAKEEYDKHVTSNATKDVDIRGNAAIQDFSAAQRDFHTLRPLMPERSRMADLTTESGPRGHAIRQEALSDLIIICGQDERVLYRPQEAPLEGYCPVQGCGQNIDM